MTITLVDLQFVNMQVPKHPGSSELVDVGQFAICDTDAETGEKQTLGYVCTNIANPPINFIVRVCDDDVAEIKRLAEIELGKPCRIGGMPPKVDTKTLKAISNVLAADGRPIEEVFEVPVSDFDEDEDQ